MLVSAYACGPGDAPEAAAGWDFATAAAINHDVLVVTRRRFEPTVRAELEEGRHPRLRVVFHDLPDRWLDRKRRPVDMYWYYALWQRSFARLATQLHREDPFDVVHHVTFANDWMPCGAARLVGIPFVWGPVGGASRSPLPLARWLGPRGVLTEVARSVSTVPARRLFGDAAARRADVVVAQNADVAARFSYAKNVVLEPNISLDGLPMRIEPGVAAPKVAVFVGRLIGWKGVRLAIAAIARLAADGWTLDVYGEGPQLPQLKRLARTLGVADAVRFRGHRPRSAVLSAVASAHVLLFPSMHDQAGWAAGEASAIGVPVVCLPLGGPPLLAERNAHVASDRGDVAGNLAGAIREAAAHGGTPHDRWSRARLPGLVDAWYRLAVESREQGGVG